MKLLRRSPIVELLLRHYTSNGDTYPYLGGGFMNAGPGWAITRSTSDPSAGWFVQAQGSLGVCGSVGTSIATNNPTGFNEIGTGSPGWSVTIFHVWHVKIKWPLW
jgi:hypothetical protein